MVVINLGVIKLTEKQVNYSPTRDTTYLVATVIENGAEVVRRIPVYAFEDILGSSYIEISIDSFSSSLSNAEIGTVITDPITLSYSCNKMPVSMKLDGVDMANFEQSDTITLTGHSISANKTWVLAATDDKGKTATKTCSL
mgnify:CR=1 FL=1